MYFIVLFHLKYSNDSRTLYCTYSFKSLAVFILQLWQCVATFYTCYLRSCKSAQLLSIMSDPLSPQSPPVQVSHASHSMSSYTNNTDHYIKSNTVFIFLSGKHHMDRPLELIDTQNVTLKLNDTENVQPSLVPQFPCEIHGQCLEIKPPDVAPPDSDEYLNFTTSNVSLCCSPFASSMSHWLT